MKKILLLSFLCQVLCAHEGLIPWMQEKSEMGNIQIREAQSGKINNHIEVPGKIVFHPDKVAYLFPKVHGVVSAIYKNLGDQVDICEVLATLESKEMAEAKAFYLSALKKRDQKRAILQSEESLQGISPKVDLWNARFDNEEACLSVDLGRQNLYALGLTQIEVDQLAFENPQDLRLYHIKSPLKGQVIQRNLTLGELVFDTTKVFTIANFEKVWVEMCLSQCDTCFLQNELPLIVISPQGKETTATLYQFNPTIDEETRRATAIGVIDNPSGIWKVGEYVTVKVQVESTDAKIVVPKTAIQTIDGENVVFIEKPEGFFVSAVCIGKMDDQNVEILSGLKEKERYAATNSFVIKADIEKED